MKMHDWNEIDETLKQVWEMLNENIYSTKDTSEDESWSLRLEQVMTEIKCLREEMIFDFRIEDDYD